MRQLNQYILFQRQKIAKLLNGERDETEREYLETLEDDDKDGPLDFLEITKGLSDAEARAQVFETRQKIPN